MRGKDLAVGAAVGAAYVAALLATTGDLGYARDEGFYFDAAASYARWLEILWEKGRAALAPDVVDRFWSANHEHPALMKGLFALSSLAQKRFAPFAMDGTSFRFPGMVVSALALVVVYLWGARARGRLTGLSAALLLGAMPRFFYHAHLACFDAPIAAVFCLVAYSYWRSLESAGWGWPLWTGVSFGLALDTKHNAWFLPFLCGAHAGYLLLRASLGRGPVRPARRALAALGSMAAIGPLVFYALWPWIWHDTWHRLQAYAEFHLNHEYYNMELFGESYWKPPMPRSYAWVMTAATVPTVTLALFLAGLALRGRAHARRLRGFLASREAAGPGVDPAATDLLWLLGVLVCYAPWLSSNTPIFGGTKHWMTAYPFLALFAGTALSEAARALASELALLARRRAGLAKALAKRPWPEAIALSAALSAPLAETAHSHPWGLSAYTPLVGGSAGAATLGLNRTFWGYTTGAVTGYLNATVPPRGTVYVHDTAGPSWDMLIRDGRLRKDIRGVSDVSGASVALYHHEKHMLGQEYQAWGVYGTVSPAHVAGLDGVPVLLVYRKPQGGEAGP